MKNTVPSMLAFSRSLSPGNFLLFGASSKPGDTADLVPIEVREEPVRGLNATYKTDEEQKSQAVLQVLETTDLPPGKNVLIMKGRVFVNNSAREPFACQERSFYAAHAKVFEEVKASSGFAELGKRYALRIACGSLAWRNLTEAESVRVLVTAGNNRWIFDNVVLDAENPFDLSAESYSSHKDSLSSLGTVIAEALSEEGKSVNLLISVELTMAPGARVYPSQEWSSEDQKRVSKGRWPGGEGVTRTLAKRRLPSGSYQAVINDRKVGNALRVIDTWYPDAVASSPIAVEVFGSSSHTGLVHRPNDKSSFFGILQKVVNEDALTPEEQLYYIALCIRGGVLGVKSE